ncbi:hypothetical protein AZI86_10750 [Bdellovibrio bacteriovorus]|uniref:Cytochrome c domain-containing protein n=1 Tax=Bdellovibrio bacteriovorus TaxID=959 RepID=A0A150WLB2_BDEBC|nr:hypothetical protein [Bdellovibrio bacteriovorus]KYG64682.1 hypothetical protein AZI86_10750 [Bdellovibrio bacteriovorus]
MRYIVFLILLITTACKTEKQQFGGTAAYVPPTSGSGGTVDDSSLAVELINSNSLKLFYSAEQTTSTAGKIDSILNQKSPADTTTTSYYHLIPNDSNLGTLENGWIKINPSTSSLSYTGSLQQDLIFNAVTIVALVRGDSLGDFISLDPLDRESQAFAVSIDGGTLRARFYSSPSDHYETSETVTSSGSNIIVANFGDDVGLITLSLNGSLKTNAVSLGTPTSPFSVARFLSLGSSLANQVSYIKELYLFNRSLTKKEMGSMIRKVAKDHSITDITLHPDLQAPTTTTPTGDPNFAPAKAVLQSSCTQCHASWASGSATYFKNVGLVVKGNAEASPLYYRLKNSTGSSGPKTMPQNSTISNSEADLIKTWINNMN